LHLIFQHAAGLRCSAEKIAAGVDVRAIGGYVIWWPAAGLPVPAEMPIAFRRGKTFLTARHRPKAVPLVAQRVKSL
jgi:hypothetical protein